MLQHLLNMTVGTIAVAGAIGENEHFYEFLSATLDGRVMVAFVDYQGTAVAIDLTEERPEVITGLAAGAILSDLRDVVGDEDDETLQVSSGIGHSEIRVDGAVRVGRVGREDVLDVIDKMNRMPVLQREQLKSTLGL